MNRRGFLFGLGAFAIVRPEIIMPVKAFALPETITVPVPPGTYVVAIDSLTALGEYAHRRVALEFGIIYEDRGNLPARIIAAMYP